MQVIYRRSIPLLLGIFWTTSTLVFAQNNNYLAIIPAFHDRLDSSGFESPLRLLNQRFVLFVYRNAVAVYSEANLVNTGSDTLTQELALPSTGHKENDESPDGKTSSGILSVQLWAEGERVMPELLHTGSGDWYTVRLKFTPGIERTVKAVFWAETSLTDVDSLPGLDTVAIPLGKRGFMVDLSHAAVWNDVIESVQMNVSLKGGLSFDRDTFSAVPDTYEHTDSTLTWSYEFLEPDMEDNVVVSYAPSGPWPSATNTMARLSAYLVTRVYGDLLYYVNQLDDR